MPFITFEGIDGSGKSTLLDLFSQHLKDLGLSVEITREPGGTLLGQELRNLLLRTQGEAPCPRAELLIYEADRAQHVEKIIQPALKIGKWVLSDRHADSSSAFQGAGRQIDLQKVFWLNDFATDGLKPDLTVLVDLPVEVSHQRMQKQGRTKDRFEVEKNGFHEAVRQEYLKLAQKESKRFLVLNGEKSQDELLHTLMSEVKRRKWL